MSTSENQEIAIENHRVNMWRAFKDLTSGTGARLVRLIDEEGHIVSMNLDLLLHFSPTVRSVLASLPLHPAWVDEEPVILLPDVSVETIIKIKKMLLNGEADKFHNSREARLVVEASDILDLGIKKLYKDGALFTTSGSNSMRSRIKSRSDGVPIIMSTSTVKKEETLAMEEELIVPHS